MEHDFTAVSSDRLRELAAYLDELDEQGVTVTGVRSDDEPLMDGEGLTVAIDIRVPLLSDVASNGVDIIADASDIDDEGSLTTTLRLHIPNDDPSGREDSTAENGDAAKAVEATADTADTDNESATASADRDTETDSEPQSRAVDDETRLSADATTIHLEQDMEDGNGESTTKPYRDPDRLRAVYEAYDSFPEMTEALDVDVTPQTVRRHMIEHGIHEPQSHPWIDLENYQDDADDDGAGLPASFDELDLPSQTEFDLPDDVTITDVVRAVKRARTVRDVHHALDLDQDLDCTRALLQDLNLLDLVSGRVYSNAEHEVTTADIEERLRAAAAGDDNEQSDEPAIG